MNYEKAIEVNNELKFNVDEQKYDIKDLKDQCDIDDEDKVLKKSQLLEPHEKNRPVCVTCNQAVVMKNGLEKHIHEEHSKLWQIDCEKIFRKRNLSRQSHV